MEIKNLFKRIGLHFTLLILNWLPDLVIFLRFRGWLASPFFKSCGKNLRLGRNLTFYDPTKIEFGNDVYIAMGCWFNGSIQVKDEVMFGPYCIVVSSNHVSKGGSYRFAGNDSEQTIFFQSGSWIGAKSVILSGSKVGRGALLAANSTLNKPMEDYSIYGGNPARLVKILNN